VQKVLPLLKEKHNPDFVIANGENAAGGRGITQEIAEDLFQWGVHGITMGNHTWDNKDIFNFIDHEERLVRPANYPEGTPGRGATVIRNQNKELVLISLMGRTFLPPLECPFRKADELIATYAQKTKCIIVDFHAEATSEKIAMAWHLDGKVSAIIGTHTHVQTNDNVIMPQGTAYVTDVGMVGSREGVLGMEKEAVLRKFMTQLPTRFNVAGGKWHFHAVLIEIDEASGRAYHIQLIRLDEDQIMFA
jgi:metallophosphoesterase (TIGR00282 family)